MAIEPKLILLVEDNELVRRYIREALVKGGFECICASTAGEALAMVEQYGARIDLMLVDVGLPGIDGVELCKHIESHYHPLPTVFITGNIGHPALRARSVGTDNVLQKPFGVGQLRAAIDRACGSARP